MPPPRSPNSGPSGLRPRVGFMPNSPQHAAGIRIDPPPSLACAIGTTPAATIAAEPPLEPPGVCSRFQGFRVTPCSSGSVTGEPPNSGVFVLPQTTRPAAFIRTTNSVSICETLSRSARHPSLKGAPAYSARRSFRRNGTPQKGTLSARPAASSSRQWFATR